MNAICPANIQILKEILEKSIVSIEFKKDEISYFFGDNQIEFLHKPMNNKIQSIQNFFTLIEQPITEETIIKLSVEDYQNVAEEIDNLIKNLINTIQSAQFFKSIESKDFLKLYDKINKVSDAKMEFVEMFNKAKWKK